MSAYTKYLPNFCPKMMRNLRKRKYKDSEFPGDFLLFLNEMRSTGEHCDVHLCVEDCVFPVHRVVLAASCTYFRAMFSPWSCFIEASNSKVCLKNVDKEAVREVLNYFYTGEFQLRISNLENVVILADMWDVPFLLDSIEDFIQRRIHVSNWNTGRFANVAVRQRPVRQRMKSVRQRLMSVRQRLYVSSPTSKNTFFVENNCQLDNLQFTS